MPKENFRTSSYINGVEVGEGSSLLYNGFTSRVDLVPSDVATQLLSSTAWRNFSFLSQDEVRHLLNRGHLTKLTIRREQEEFRRLAEQVLQHNLAYSQRKNANKVVAFILTYQCNLSCTYCYQHILRNNTEIPSMDVGFLDDFFGLYLDKLFPGFHKKRMEFRLFGGEPLLPGNRRSIERILRYAKKYGIVVSTSSNTLMLPHMLDLIGPERGKINSVQVTLDGGQAFHDKTRITRLGTPTFTEIIGSIRQLIKVKSQVTIRIHLHPEGLESIHELVEFLEQKKILGNDHVYAYFAPISSIDDTGLSPSYQEDFSEFFQHVSFIQKNPPCQFARNLQGMIDTGSMKNSLRTRFCSAGADVIRVVDSLGDIYDCYEEAGNKSRRIANLSHGEVRYFKLKETYNQRHVLNLPQCLKCSVALYCGGGCLSQARLHKGSVFKPFCQQNKEFIAQTLKAHFLLNQKWRAGSAGRPIH